MESSFSTNVTENNKQRKADLKMRKKKLEDRIKRRKIITTIFSVLGICLLFLTIITAIARPDTSAIKTVILIVISATYASIPFLVNSRQITSMIFDIEREIDLLESEDSVDNRSETLFKQHHLELKRYYDLNLTQNSLVFWVGIFCIGVGFAIIGYTIYLISGNMLANTQNKLIVAGTGALAGILSNFIGAIYLRMHTNSTNSLTEFHNRFVNTHHFYFSNFLISQIKDEQRREETLANLALSINKEYQSKEQNSE
ncbi:hypothetical protein D0808_15680 [Bacillus subtilis]|uniref:TRADD-N-associated membrane domain-containing protein n=1 Tax=Bacillus subtilis TaxID=1423 RepID=UPI001293AF9B|nr:hypothetical protein [Bacillus subtilis]QFY82739.1 hypothetical protein D0808_15680 [Bacillus subtilis]